MISKSPDRHSFQKNSYKERCKEKGEEPNPDYLEYFEQIIENHDKKFDDLESTKDNLEYDLLTTDWILEKVRSSEVYAQNLYAAICNNDFQKLDVIPILTEKTWSASWRYAGGIIADMRQKGDYIDWYCSGIGCTTPGFVSEMEVTDEIREDLKKLGWKVIDQNNNF